MELVINKTLSDIFRHYTIIMRHSVNKKGKNLTPAKVSFWTKGLNLVASGRVELAKGQSMAGFKRLQIWGGIMGFREELQAFFGVLDRRGTLNLMTMRP